MITVFNRKEVLVTPKLEHQANARDILTANHIDYVVKVDNLLAGTGLSARRVHGTIGADLSQAYLYHIYVKKSDYDKAIGLLKGAR